MSRNQRIGLVVAALAVAVIAFLVARPGNDNKSSGAGGTGTQAQAQSEPPVARINVKGGVLDGTRQTIRVAKGDLVRIVVSSDAPDQIHLHGYNIEKEATPGKPARFRFKADTEGAFDIESHAAEHAGKDPLLARLLVGPS